MPTVLWMGMLWVVTSPLTQQAPEKLDFQQA
jgi:hypothetical protein